MLPVDWQFELFKTLLSIIVAITTLSFGWIVGNRLTVYWAIRQKRRELELSAVNEFYKLYGEFFAVWKLWSYYLDSADSADNLKLADTIRWDLLKRASAAEGALESILVKLSSERILSDEDTEILGKFRQAYQKLRESIKNNSNIGWHYHTHPEYLTFKRLAHLVACLILSDTHYKKRTENHKSDTLENITANVWENNWAITDEDWNRLKVRSGNSISS